MSHHFIRDEDLVDEVRQIMRRLGFTGSAGGDGQAAMAETRIRRFLHHQRTLPDLVGVAEAADLLGVRKPRIYRLADQGRMPEPLVELAGGPVYLREEVSALAATLQEEREGREARRAEKEAAA